MSFPACSKCGAELGPWEASTCLSHGPKLTDRQGLLVWRRTTIGDLAVMALEREDGPVSIYDVQRVVDRDYGRALQWQSLTSVMGSDLRFCWSGKGIYGLFRHDRIPGIRGLSGAAQMVLSAHGDSLRFSELAFVLKWAGYRFQDVSLEGALYRDAELGFEFVSPASPHWEMAVRMGDGDAGRRPLAEAILHSDGTAFRRWPVDELVTRWRDKVASGLAEMERRLRNDPRPPVSVHPNPAPIAIAPEDATPADGLASTPLEASELSPEVNELREMLLEIARSEKVSSYQPIGKLFGLDMRNPSHRRRIGELLADVSRFEVAHGRPMLSSVVVQADTSMPGQGFYTLGLELDLVRLNEDEMAFSVRQLNEVFAHWRRSKE